MSSKSDQLSSFLNKEYVNDEFFIDIIQNKLNISRDKFKIVIVLITPATGKNENYVSLVLRAKIKVQFLETNKNELIDVIIKVSAESFEDLNELSVFTREEFIYEKPLKCFEEIWLKNAGEEVIFAPKSLKFVGSPCEIIVLDDLKAYNYVILDRKQGLNLEQSKVFLSKLAKFHAAGAVQFQREGYLKDFLDRNCESAPKPNIKDPFTNMHIQIFEAFVRALRSYGDCDQYAEKISKWDKLWVGTCYLHESAPMKCGLQVLNHGDVWTNNLMFRWDPLDVLMVDYQMSFWGSPTYDILLFLMLSVQDDIKVAHFDDIIEFYYREFSESLVKVKYDRHIPSLDEFKDDIKEKGHIAASFLPFLFFAKHSSNEAFTLDTFMGATDESALKKIYDDVFSDPFLIRATKVWLPFMEERGFLDSLIKNK